LKVSIVVPAYNEERLIGRTLDQLRQAMSAFSSAGWDAELIVCDNNSTDRTAVLARTGGAKVVFEPMNQIGRARNTGATAASGDWLVFVDADSHPSLQLFEDVIEQIRSGRCVAGGSTVKIDGDYPAAARVAGIWNWVSRTFHILAGSFIFCETAAFREIGGFSQELFASEELDLTKRLKQLGRRTKRRVVILNRHPLLTSARKIHLYTLREHLWFLAKTMASGGRVLKNREACHTWYDGRR